MADLDVQEGDYVEVKVGKKKKGAIGGYVVSVGPMRVRVRVEGGRNRMFYLNDVTCWIKNPKRVRENQS